MRDDSGDPVAIARQACDHYGLNSQDVSLLKHYSNAVVLVPGEQAVARVAMGKHDPDQIRRSLHVTRWLHDQHKFPTIVPLCDYDVVEVSPTTSVSFWEYIPQPDPPEPFWSTDLARLLRHLHSLPQGPVEVPAWEPLTSLADALRDEQSDILSGSERDWITERIAAVRQRLAAADWIMGTGLVHGDAWAGNLLANPRGVALGDWDRVAHGPREIDLIPTWHAARRYGRDSSWVNDFIDVYGHDLTVSPYYDNLMTMRDLAQLPGPLRRAPHSEAHAAALHQRLTDLRAGNTSTSWVAL